jgi:cytochrome c oxidase assembly factor CtaG
LCNSAPPDRAPVAAARPRTPSGRDRRSRAPGGPLVARVAAGLALAALTWPTGVALAHDDQPLAPHDLWRAWGSDPLALLAVGLAAGVYARGVRTLWQRAGRGRGTSDRQVAVYAAGLVALLVALASPIDALSAALLSAHMVQHLLLILVAAPLLCLGWSPSIVLWTLPAPWRRAVGSWWRRAVAIRRGWRALTGPAVAWSLHALAVWVWHLPSLYQSALRSWPVHALEHASFLGTAGLFWWAVARCGAHGGLGHGLGMLYVLTGGIQSGVLGALIALDDAPWYPLYATTTAAWGTTPLDDQRLAGLLMWVPGGSLYLVGAIALLVGWAAREARPTAGRRALVAD